MGGKGSPTESVNYGVVNRPGVAGAVLHTASFLEQPLASPGSPNNIQLFKDIGGFFALK